MLSAPPELTEHLVGLTATEAAVVERLLREILEYFDEDPETFVRRRHGQLKARGWRNDRIWPQIALEMDGRPFRSRALSQRQLRRIVYG
jgi:hypothetical protein